MSPSELVELSLERIARVDPRLNAFRVVFADRARTEAQQAEARRGAGDRRPLLGVPVAVKDDMDVAGEVTAQGTGANQRPAQADSEIVRRLREAGAIIIGKTNVPELTMWPFTETATWGVTRNPWDLDRTPGGSSGGSGSAVAAGLVAAATASDGLGSIRIPAACSGLFGLKPQYRRVPTAPKGDDAWHGIVHYGTVTRSVRDSALFLDAVADRPSWGTFAEAAGRPAGQLRIAVSTRVPPPVMAPLDPRVVAAVDETAQLLRGLGHTVVQRDPDYDAAAMARGLARYFRGILDDAAATEHPERLERRSKAMARIGRLIPGPVLARSLAETSALTERLGRLWDDVDVLLTPTLTSLPLAVGAFEGRGALWTFNGVSRFVPHLGIWNMTGQPAASVPAGFTPEGVPLAVHLVARSGDEATLMSLSAQIEAERPWADRRPPIAS
ncbi:Putative amidase AmiB2 [Capillimicrobium parvum]|uniref:Amidase AmiB2 n=1 Tax=Capillimicrobium parvum TaxID=2884022 RepID=A0A9E6XWN4_9ACTN|nr:Putative amidase AmiB2 [Capillimicrobium parvum]